MAKKTIKKMSQIDAALKVLAATRKPMTCQELVEAMAAKRLWKLAFEIAAKTWLSKSFQIV